MYGQEVTIKQESYRFKTRRDAAVCASLHL